MRYAPVRGIDPSFGEGRLEQAVFDHENPSNEVPKLAWRDAVGVENGVQMAQRVEQAAERTDVPDLGRVPVLRQLILDVPAVFDDVGAVLGERPGDVLEQARAVPRVDGDLHAEALCGGAVPVDRSEPLGVAA